MGTPLDDSSRRHTVLSFCVKKQSTGFVAVTVRESDAVFVGTHDLQADILPGDTVVFEGVRQKPPFRNKPQCSFRTATVIERGSTENVDPVVFTDLIMKHMHGLGRVGAREILDAWGGRALAALQDLQKGLLTHEEFAAGRQEGGLSRRLNLQSARMQSLIEHLPAFVDKLTGSVEVINAVVGKGFSINAARKAVAEYGTAQTSCGAFAVVDAIDRNPYVMTSFDAFDTVDGLCTSASGFAIQKTDQRRLDALIVYALRRKRILDSSSNSYETVDDLLRFVRSHIAADRDLIQSLGVHLTTSEVQSAKYATDFRVAGGTKVVQTSEMKAAEDSIAAFVKEAAGPRKVSLEVDEAALATTSTDLSDFFGSDSGLQPDSEQLRAVTNLFHSMCSILCGIPGGGKSASIAMMAHCLQKMNGRSLAAGPKKMLILSFTAKAVRRVEELFRNYGVETQNVHTSTIHSFIARTDHCSGDLEQYSYLIVDEASMTGLVLCQQMLAAAAKMKAMPLVAFVGDEAQLPPIDTGSVFRDLLQVDCLRTVRLTTSHRNIGRVLENANAILRGEQIQFDADQCRLVQGNWASDSDVCAAVIEQLGADEAAAEATRDSPPAVICRTNKLVDAINPVMQRRFNAPAPGKDEHAHFDVVYRVGDRVMNTKNIRVESAIIANGEMGAVVDIVRAATDQTAVAVRVAFDGATLSYAFRQATAGAESHAQISNLKHAYAFTVHKSQGSQYDRVYAVMPPYPHNLVGRAMLLTAWSRAVSQVTVFGSKKKLLWESNDTRLTDDRKGLLEEKIAALFAKKAKVSA